tara:strand:- start:3686 stop:3838 length:153 start_codon:yes stop_codon:yes gene_type:complete
VRIPERLYGALDRYAEAHGHGLSYVIVTILKRFQPLVKARKKEKENADSQ